MAISNFLKLDGIDGEATDRSHRGEIELLSWSWGVTNEPASGGSGSGVGRPMPQALLFVHRYDKASPPLARLAVSGRHLRTAVLSARRSGAGQRDFLVVTLKEVLVTALQMADNGDGPVEQVSLRFGEIGFSYTPQTPRGGVGTPVAMNWNVRTSQVT
ncbi:MAG: type VI secretion system tube protein Hcp [Piscinibacter sp.]